MSKVIENKQTKLEIAPAKFASYADLLASLINKPVPEGISVSDLRRDLTILGKLDDVKGDIKVTEDELTYLKDVVAKSKWAIRHLDILDFVDYIDSIK